MEEALSQHSLYLGWSGMGQVSAATRHAFSWFDLAPSTAGTFRGWLPFCCAWVSSKVCQRRYVSLSACSSLLAAVQVAAVQVAAFLFFVPCAC